MGRPGLTLVKTDHKNPSGARRHKCEPGACVYCDREREAGNSFHPSHDASPRCESGKRPHCSCSACF